MAISKTARKSGATGKVKKTGGGAPRSKPKAQKSRRAHKRDSAEIPPAAKGQGRDDRKAAKRAERAAYIDCLVKDAEERALEREIAATMEPAPEATA